MSGRTSGETDLAAMLATLDVEVRTGTYAYATSPTRDPTFDGLATARIDEVHSVTYVLPMDTARAHGLHVVFEAAWLTLTMHSALHAVGGAVLLFAAAFVLRRALWNWRPWL